MGKLGLMDIVEVKEFQTDDEDRIRGCYNSHIEIYKEIAAKYAGAEDYSVLVLEDNVSESPQLSQSTVSNLASFQSQRSGDWDMLHLAYIMYVPGLQVTRTEMDGVVSLSTGEQAALGTTAYVISKKGVDALLEYHEKVSRR
jgi:GR25 family glycosyltransferase involved in LPS biosynthesis